MRGGMPRPVWQRTHVSLARVGPKKVGLTEPTGPGPVIAGVVEPAPRTVRALNGREIPLGVPPHPASIGERYAEDEDGGDVDGNHQIHADMSAAQVGHPCLLRKSNLLRADNA